MSNGGKSILFTNPIIRNATNINKIKKQNYLFHPKYVKNDKLVKINDWIPYIISVVCFFILLFIIFCVLIYIRNKRSLNGKNLITHTAQSRFSHSNSDHNNNNNNNLQIVKTCKNKEKVNNCLNFQSINNVISHLKKPRKNNVNDESKNLTINLNNVVVKEVQPIISKNESFYLGNSNTLTFATQDVSVIAGYQHFRNHSDRLIKQKGLLESRRGSRTSLTLSLSASIDSIASTRSFSPSKTDIEQDRLTLEQNSCYLSINGLDKKVNGDAEILFQEFWSIPMNQSSRYELSISGMANKNRYKSIIPNEKTRVILPEIEDNYLSSYINANYIRGYKNTEKQFIATQGPMPQTVVDFWRLVWHVRASAIVMLTKLVEQNKKKCEYYLPNDIKKEESFGNIHVSIKNIHFMRGYTVRKLIIKFENEILLCTHYWFTSWPDHGSPTPETTTYLLSLLESLEYLKINKTGLNDLNNRHNISADLVRPLVVHCSAGLGRTGCFIALCTGCLQLRCESGVDILGIVSHMRLDRGGMINNNEQYEFLHHALLQYAHKYCLTSSSCSSPGLKNG